MPKNRVRNGVEPFITPTADVVFGLFLLMLAVLVVLVMLVGSSGEPPSLEIHTDRLADAVAYKKYEAGIAVSGGIGPYKFSVEDDELPPGIFLDDKENGLIRGVPRKESLTDTGSVRMWEFPVTVSDALGMAATNVISVEVYPSAVPFDPDKRPLRLEYCAHRSTTEVRTASGAVAKSPEAEVRTPKDCVELPDGVQDTPYSCSLSILGGIEPYRVRATGLPRGLHCDNEGRLSGTPHESGTFEVVVELRDEQDPYDRYPATVGKFTLTVRDPLAIQVVLHDEPRVGEVFHGAVLAQGGSGRRSFELVGTLPSGLTLDGISGIIAGVPEEEENSAGRVVVSDGPQQQEAEITIDVLPPRPKFEISVPRRLADARVGESYYFALAHSGGVAPIKWLCDGMPDGLVLAEGSNLITGIPKASPGEYVLSVTATDARGKTQGGKFQFRIRPPLMPLQFRVASP